MGTVGKTAKCPRCKRQGKILETACIKIERIDVGFDPTGEIDLSPEYRVRIGDPVQRIRSSILQEYPGTTLTRLHFTVVDPLMPAGLLGCPALWPTVVTDELTHQSTCRFETRFAVLTKENVTAIEVTFLLFDLWNNFMSSLKRTVVVDLPKDSAIADLSDWQVQTVSDIDTYHSSIAFVSAVRTAEGRVAKTDMRVIRDLLTELCLHRADS